MKSPTPGRFVAEPKVEAFFQDVLAAGRKHALSDAELIAVLSKTVGLMVAAAKPGKDQDTLRDTAAFNIEAGGSALSNAVNGLRRLG